MFQKRDNIQNLNTRQGHTNLPHSRNRHEPSTKGFSKISRNSPVGKFPSFF